MTEERQNWVWITKPDYYLDEDDADRASLDPASEPGGDGSWWTCHQDTRAGDLVLLYRTAPKSDIAYLMEAASGARRLGTRPDDGVVTLEAFSDLTDRALIEESRQGSGAIVRESKARLDDAEAATRKSYEALRTYGWKLSNLDDAQAEHERWELELGERERREGLDAVQSDWDRWGEQQDALVLVQGFAEVPDAVEGEREILAYEVFLKLDMPEDTVLETQSEFKGTWVCSWVPRYKFEFPIPLGTLRNDGWLCENWNALRAAFNGSFFKFEPAVWDRVIELAAAEGNAALPGLVAKHSGSGPSQDIVSEHTIRDALAAKPAALGLGNLALFVDPLRPERTGVEYPCTDVGFVDLLMTDDNGDLTVVELKTNRAGQSVIGQIAKYVGWIQRNLAVGRSVRGVVVSDGYDAKYAAAAPLLGLTHIEVSAVKDGLGL